MVHTIKLSGSVPSKKNNKQIKFRHGRATLQSSDNFQAWHEEQMYAYALKRAPKIKGPVKMVELEFFVDSKRKADLTNKAESIMDLLVDAGIIEDDNYFIVPEVRMRLGGVDVENPRVNILITDLE